MAVDDSATVHIFMSDGRRKHRVTPAEADRIDRLVCVPKINQFVGWCNEGMQIKLFAANFEVHWHTGIFRCVNLLHSRSVDNLTVTLRKKYKTLPFKESQWIR